MGRDISLIKLFGAANVSVGGVNVGHVNEEGVKLALTNNIVEAKAGQFGQAPVGAWLNGQTAEITFTLVQTELENLDDVLPGGNYVTGSGKKKVTFGSNAGTPLTAVQLIFTPIISANTPAYDLTVPKAVPVGDFELTYSGEGHNMWTCTFRVLINEAGGTDGNWMFVFGDASATADVVVPTVSSVAPVNNDTGVVVTTNVVWTMSEDLDGNTVDLDSVRLIEDPLGTAVKIAGAVTLNNAGASTTITFNPTSNLSAATKYTASLNDSIKDLNGNALAFYQTEFDTA